MPEKETIIKPVFEKRRSLASLKGSPRLRLFFKFFLPLKAIILFISILVWPYLKIDSPTPLARYTAQDVLGNTTENTASRPQFNGVDRQNQPYILVADHMVQTDEGNLILTTPHLTLFLKSGATVLLKSNKAYFNQKSNLVELIDHVVLTHSTGYEFTTSQAWINLNDMESFGEKPVEGQGPAGHIQAPNGFKLWDNGDKIKFLGRSELIILK